MSCVVHEEDISALMDGEIEAVEERRLRAHLAVCDACRRRLAVYRRLSATLRATEGELPDSPAFLDRVVAAARPPVRRARVRSVPSLRFLANPLAAAAAVFLCLGLAAGYLVSESRVPAAPGAAPVAESPALALYRERAAAIADGDAGAHLVLARWCAESGLPEVAAREYLRALAADPASAEARRALADLLPALPAGGDDLLAAIGDDPDFGPELPEPPSLRPPTRGERLAALGFDRAGDRLLTAAARRRAREHRDEERLLAAAAERKRSLLAQAVKSATHPVATFLASLAPADPVAEAGMTVVFLRDGDGDAGVRVLGAREAIEAGVLVVTEDRTDGRLLAKNTDPSRHVFLAAGEVLVGGQQDRLLIRDVLLPPSTTDRLPVVCCERERWTGPTMRFTASAGIAPPAIRRLLVGARDQTAIWNRIAAELVRLEATNDTQALRAIFTEGRGPRPIAAAAEALAPALADRRTVGFLVYRDGVFVGGETFADHEVFRALAPRYLEAYALDGAGATAAAGAAVTPPAARSLLDSVSRAAFYRSPGAGSGEETEFVGRDGGLSGRALVPVAGARPLHVTLFRSEAAEEEEEGKAPPPAADEPADTETDSGPGTPPAVDDRGAASERGRARRRGGGGGLTPGDLEPKGENPPRVERPQNPPNDPPARRVQPPRDDTRTPPRNHPVDPPRLPGREDPSAVR